MEIESNETCESPVEKYDSQQVDNLEIHQPQSTDKAPDLSKTTDDEDGRIDPEKKSDDSNGNITDDSFKKPNLLIGPRRGKPGQTRVVSEPIHKETNEQPCIPSENIPDEDNTTASEGAKVSICDKQQIPLQYKEPSWGGEPLDDYKIEVLKSGVILETIDISKKSFYVVGRLPTCDISLAHPTISRYHAVLQYRETAEDKHPRGFYLFDLGSTHGTFWNGCRIRPNTYARLQGGHMFKFGCSQRKFIIQTPPEDVEEESELTVTELKEKRRLQLMERELMAREEEKRAEEAERLRLEKEERDGIDWGMGEDADEESDLTENPYASTNNEELFLDDPKKTLRGWFEREGHELQYQTEEKGIGQFLCWVDIPIDGADGRTVKAEALVKGKKKESVIQCALEACRILDRHGVLRQATHKARKRVTRNWEEEDFYDSDEDNFLDRTGTVEKKREQRMRQAGKLEDKVETYTSLLEKHTAIVKKISDIQSQLKKSQKLKEHDMDASGEDALDAFMSSLNSTIFNKADVTKLKLELQSLRKEEERLLKLVNITKPANLPSLTSQINSESVPKLAESVRNSKVSKRRWIDRESPVPEKLALTAEKNVTKTEAVDPEAQKPLEVTSANINSPETGSSIEDQRKDVEPSTTESSKNATISEPKAPRTSSEGSEKSLSEIAKKKKKNLKRMQQRAEKAAKESQKGYKGEVYSEDYSMWLPPENQSGDGKTTLNDKYGY